MVRALPEPWRRSALSVPAAPDAIRPDDSAPAAQHAVLAAGPDQDEARCGLHPVEGWASGHAQNGTRLQELMELGRWSGYEMVLRYAHLATDHLRDTAGRIDGAFTPRHAAPDRAWCALRK